MNYLAHACLSFGKPAYLVGNFLGDFVKNKDLEQLTPEVVLGVKLHRTIDVFTDTHPLMRRILIVSSIVGSFTSIFWNRRSSARSFSK